MSSLTVTDSGPNNFNVNSVITTGLDASFTFDGQTIDQPSNNISNLISGLNVNLLGTGIANLFISPTDQSSNVSTAVQNVVNTYNQIITTINQALATTSPGDAALTMVASTLENVMNSTFSGNSLGTLSNIGITTQNAQSVAITLANGTPGTYYQTGLLTVDTSVLSTALENNFSNVQSLLTDSTNGIFTKLSNVLDTANSGSITVALGNSTSSANQQLNNLNDQISTLNQQIAEQQQNLLTQYADFSLMLSKLQQQDALMFQQIAVLNKG